MSTSTARRCMTIHNVGRIAFGVSNYGWINIGRDRVADCIIRRPIPFADYPIGSNTTYLFKGALWVGGIIGDDTLVSTGGIFNNQSSEMFPQFPLELRSILEPNSPTFDLAVSEQDIIAVYRDGADDGRITGPFDELERRPHKPLGIEVTQRSFAWSYDYADDFVIFEFDIHNIGDQTIRDVVVGLYMDTDIHVGSRSVTIQPPPDGSKGLTGGRDDLTGFLNAVPERYRRCDLPDTVQIAWGTDNDGDGLRVPNIIGTKFLVHQRTITDMSYNWWIWNGNPFYDFGPQKKANFRNMGNGSGSPIGDRNRYAQMANGEIDYDQMITPLITSLDSIWVASGPRIGFTYGRGGDHQWVHSVGKFDMRPGSRKKIPVAIVGGENFHVLATNWRRYLSNTYDPSAYYDHADFGNLIDNAVSAWWVYDNPGVDTDEDGYAGDIKICVLDSSLVDGEWISTLSDTFYVTGDGVPDLRGSAPPAPPRVLAQPTYNGILIRFNGSRSETERDIFSGLIDFEGYRVYIARDDREESYSLLASYDLENYDKFTYNADLKPRPNYELKDTPFTLEELRCLYGTGLDPCADSSFDPLRFTHSVPWIDPDYPDSILYFKPHNFNRYRLGVTTDIRKVYPDEPKPVVGQTLSADQLTEDGLPRYYEYECIATNLLPTIPYFVNVTAFDFGSPQSRLGPLESSVAIGAQSVYPATSEAMARGEETEIYIYPNPYRIDGNYRQRGYEGRSSLDKAVIRTRAIHFRNLPPKCTIWIYSIDGDLIRSINHDVDPSDPKFSHDQWDLITRNAQAVVSGLYYWVVELADGQTQIGKLVILM